MVSFSGVCVIINNRNFIVSSSDPLSKEMPERRGTDVDACKSILIAEYFI